jgi:hypothetical protein
LMGAKTIADLGLDCLSFQAAGVGKQIGKHER